MVHDVNMIQMPFSYLLCCESNNNYTYSMTINLEVHKTALYVHLYEYTAESVIMLNCVPQSWRKYILCSHRPSIPTIYIHLNKWHDGVLLSFVANSQLHMWLLHNVNVNAAQVQTTNILMKSTKVLNPRRCIMCVHEKYTCAYTRNTHAVRIRMLYRYAATKLLGNSEHTG